MFMATSSSSLRSSSYSTRRWDVFISFRGVDTRRAFTGHLHSALAQVGIRTFIDVEIGNATTSVVLQAIQDSKISVVVLSRNYASSTWCLEELVQILQCRKTNEQVVIPVFLGIEPSDVRHQRGSFADAFEKHVIRFRDDKDKVGRWRAALAEVASLSGYVQPIEYEFEAQVIQQLVKNIQIRLGPEELNLNKSNLFHFTRSSSTLRWHVFLSFRGIDTRNKFTGHLYMALKRVGINAFLDDEGLSKGEDVKSELHKAIQQSKCLIVVFSKNYATSRWCLDELVKIMEYNKNGKFFVPIFCDVSPSDVRYQRGSFAEALKRHEEKYKVEKKTVQRWRDALTDAGYIVGWDVEDAWKGNEPKLIQNVIERVLLKVNPKYLYVAEHPVGTDSRVSEINSLLSPGSDDVLLIGIYGMGGIGKTTIARAVYNSNFHRFDGSCFIANVSEEVSKRSTGLVSLQEQLLLEILGNESFQVGLVQKGVNLMEDRFCSKKIFLVLDDVDELSQVKALAEKRFFGSGSIIVITTRAEDLLNAIQVNKRYCVEGLTEKESLELFSWHAFRKSAPLEAYESISKNIASYAKGLPLALEVLGSHLYGKTLEESECTFEKLHKIPNTTIQKILRISYDSLDDDDVKNIFLDIACFFVGMNKDDVIYILDACGFFTKSGIRNLMDRGLLKIDKENNLGMHDLLRDMGREIVREKSPEPKTRSRLWRQTEVCDVLRKKKKGNGEVEGITLDLTGFEQRQFSTEAFEGMDHLRLLLVNNVYLTGSFEQIFEELKWLRWHYCPLKCLPLDFHPEKLVILDLQNSKLERLWEGIKFLENLKILDLSYSEFLEETPDFSEVPKLEKLLLEGCTSLVDFHSSIEHLDKLVYLNLKACKKLRQVPSSICNIKSLDCLDLDGCSSLEKLPDLVGLLTSLKSLSLDECNKSLITSPSRLGFVPPHISSLCLLTKFSLDGCNLSDEDIPDNIGSLSSLTELHLNENCFRRLPSTFSQLSKLEDLWLMNCSSLLSVPDLPPSLQRLHADGCTSMVELPDLSIMNHLEDLYLQKCTGLTEIHGLENLSSVRSIRMEGCSSLNTTCVDSLVQKYTEHSQSFQFFFPRSEIPGWFSHRRTGPLIYFDMPFDVNSRAGITLWIVYRAKEECAANYSPSAVIKNVQKEVDMRHFCLYNDISVTNEEHSWVTYITLTNFDFPIEGGERFEVRIKEHPAVVVKECGIYTRRSR